MVPALAQVHVEEHLHALVLLDAALEDTCQAALDELIVDDVVGGLPTMNLSGLSLVHGEDSILQIL